MDLRDIFKFGVNTTELRKEAVDLGMCERRAQQWCENISMDDLLELFLTEQTFCIKHDFPKLGYMKRHGGKKLIEHGIYICGEHETSLKRFVAMGDSNVRLVTGEYGVAICYARHNATVEIESGHHSKIFVNVYDEASVNISENNKGDVKIMRHGEQR